MPLPQPPFTGRCLCGAIQIAVTAPPLLTLACHCRDCQKLCASAFSLTTMFPAEAFFLTGDLIIGGRGHGARQHFFCKSCLNFVYSRIGSASSRINLRTSLLDAAADFAPFVELMTNEKLPWVTLPVAHRFAEYPMDQTVLQALMSDFAAR